MIESTPSLKSPICKQELQSFYHYSTIVKLREPKSKNYISVNYTINQNNQMRQSDHTNISNKEFYTQKSQRYHQQRKLNQFQYQSQTSIQKSEINKQRLQKHLENQKRIEQSINKYKFNYSLDQKEQTITRKRLIRIQSGVSQLSTKDEKQQSRPASKLAKILQNTAIIEQIQRKIQFEQPLFFQQEINQQQNDIKLNNINQINIEQQNQTSNIEIIQIDQNNSNLDENNNEEINNSHDKDIKNNQSLIKKIEYLFNDQINEKGKIIQNNKKSIIAINQQQKQLENINHQKILEEIEQQKILNQQLSINNNYEKKQRSEKIQELYNKIEETKRKQEQLIFQQNNNQVDYIQQQQQQQQQLRQNNIDKEIKQSTMQNINIIIQKQKTQIIQQNNVQQIEQQIEINNNKIQLEDISNNQINNQIIKQIIQQKSQEEINQEIQEVQQFILDSLQQQQQEKEQEEINRLDQLDFVDFMLEAKNVYEVNYDKFKIVNDKLKPIKPPLEDLYEDDLSVYNSVSLWKQINKKYSKLNIYQNN